MTTATENRRLRELLAEALTTISDFYLDHPDHPIPSSITFTTQYMTEKQVRDYADKWCDGNTYGQGIHIQADHEIWFPGFGDRDLRANFIIAGRRDCTCARGDI